MSQEITCDNCGACCMRQNLLPSTWRGCDEQYAKSLPKELHAELDAALYSRRVGDDNMPCIWLDRATGKCVHHDLRPSICREMEVGGEVCRRWREEFDDDFEVPAQGYERFVGDPGVTLTPA